MQFSTVTTMLSTAQRENRTLLTISAHAASRAAGRRAACAAGRVVTRAGRAGGRVPRMPHAPPQVLPHLTLGGRLSLHPDRTSYCGAVCEASVLVVNLSAGRRCLWSAIDGSRTLPRDRRRDGLGTFAFVAAFDRSAASAAPTRARRRRIQPFAGAATAFDGAWTSPPEQPA